MKIVLTLAFFVFVSLSAHSQDNYWKAYLQGGGTSFHGSPVEACRVSHASYSANAGLTPNSFNLEGKSIGCTYNPGTPGYWGTGGSAVLDCGSLPETNDSNWCGKPNDSSGCSSNNPINISSGAKSLVQTDFVVGTGRLHFTRFYNNLAFHHQNGLAKAWSSNFHPRVRGDFRTAGGRFQIIEPSGEVLNMYKLNNGPWVFSGLPYNGDAGWVFGGKFSYREDRHDYEMITVSSTELTLIGPDRVERDFEFEWKIYRAIKPKMTKIRHPDGYTIDLNYNPDDVLESVTDSFGHTITFGYNARGLLESATAPDGTVYKYEYVEGPNASYYLGAGQVYGNTWHFLSILSKVIYPDGTPGTDSDNPFREYKYEHPTYWTGLTSLVDERGITTHTWDYAWHTDYGYRAISSVGPMGRELTTIEEVTPRQQYRVTNALGKQALYNYQQIDVMPYLTSVDGVASANCAASVDSISHNSKGYITSITKAEGQVETRSVDTSNGLLNSVTYGAGTSDAVTVDYLWDAAIRKPTEISYPGLRTNIVYGTDQLPSQVTYTDTTSHSQPYSTNGQQRVWGYTWQPNGLLQSIDGPLPGSGDSVSFTYDTDGFLASVTDVLGHTTTISSVDGMGRTTQFTDANGVSTSIAYTERGWVDLVTETSGLTARVTNFDYDLAGNLTRIDFPNGGWLSFTYDDSSWLTNVNSSTGDQIVYQHDLLGNITRADLTSGGGNAAWFTMQYDELGRLMQRLGGAGDSVNYGYDRSNRMTSVTDGLGRPWLAGFDALDRVVSQTDPEMHMVQYALDSDGDLTTFTDARNFATEFTRNGFGEVIREVSPDRGTTDYWRDAAGHVTRMLDAEGDDVLFTVDAAGRVLTETYPNQTALNVTYTYDDVSGGNSGRGRLTSVSGSVSAKAITYNGFGNITSFVSTVGGQTYPQTLLRNSAGELTKHTLPSGREVNYVYDTSGRIIDVTTNAAGGSIETIVSGVTYAPFGPMTGYAFGNGAIATIGVDASHRLSSLDVTGSGPSLLSKSYGYDNNSRVAYINDNLNSAHDATYSYTLDGRITSAVGPWGDFSWTYDAVGNRLSDTRYAGGSLLRDDDFVYSPSSNRLLSVNDSGGGVNRMISYTSDGNINTDIQTSAPSRDYDYGDDGRLETVSIGGAVVATYDYDAFEQRVRRTESGTVTHFVFSSDGRLIGEYDGATGSVISEYIWLADRLVGIVNGAGVISFVQTGHLGQPMLVMDGSAAMLWQGETTPFGVFVATSGSGSDPDLRFPGQWLEAGSGLYQNWHRDYDPTIGRYIEADPLGIAAGQSVYGYAGQDPLNLVDPEGLRAGPLGGATALFTALAVLLDGISDNLVCQMKNAGGGMPPGGPDWGSAFGEGFDRLGGHASDPLNYIPAGRAFKGFKGASGSFGGFGPKADPARGPLRDFWKRFIQDERGGRNREPMRRGIQPNKRQNKQARSALREALGKRSKISKEMEREFHDAITGQDYSYQELVDIAKELFE